MALPEHLDLCGSQRRRRRQLLLQDTSVETFHQLRSFGGSMAQACANVEVHHSSHKDPAYRHGLKPVVDCLTGGR